MSVPQKAAKNEQNLKPINLSRKSNSLQTPNLTVILCELNTKYLSVYEVLKF